MQSSIHVWEPLSVSDVVAVFSKIPCWWCIAGGYALDLFLEKQAREHADIDIARHRQCLAHRPNDASHETRFGGDINANSVKICRLRLWIELLKSAYYRRPTPSFPRTRESNTSAQLDSHFHGNDDVVNQPQLETLPNIDINIKHGDSLVSRFDLKADVGNAIRGGKWTVESYLNAVKTYQASRTRDDKQQLRQLLSGIKNDFREHTSPGGPQQRK